MESADDSTMKCFLPLDRRPNRTIVVIYGLHGFFPPHGRVHKSPSEREKSPWCSCVLCWGANIFVAWRRYSAAQTDRTCGAPEIDALPQSTTTSNLDVTQNCAVLVLQSSSSFAYTFF